jgi:hypothetical protein
MAMHAHAQLHQVDPAKLRATLPQHKVTKINKSSYTITGIKMTPLKYEDNGTLWGISSPIRLSGFTFNIPFDTLEKSVYCGDWEWQSVPYGNGQASYAHFWRVWSGGAVFRSIHDALQD